MFSSLLFHLILNSIYLLFPFYLYVFLSFFFIHFHNFGDVAFAPSLQQPTLAYGSKIIKYSFPTLFSLLFCTPSSFLIYRNRSMGCYESKTAIDLGLGCMFKSPRGFKTYYCLDSTSKGSDIIDRDCDLSVKDVKSSTSGTFR